MNYDTNLCELCRSREAVMVMPITPPYKFDGFPVYVCLRCEHAYTVLKKESETCVESTQALGRVNKKLLALEPPEKHAREGAEYYRKRRLDALAYTQKRWR